MAIEERPRAATKRGRRSLLAGVVAVALLGGLTTVGIQATASAATITGPKIEICKGGPVSGTYQFSVDQQTTVSVAVGTCKGVGVTTGTHTVTELVDTSGLTSLSKIQITPSTAGTGNVGTRTATVNVTETTNPLVRFVNEPNSSLLKICKVAGDPAINGKSFTFEETAGGSTIITSGVIAAPAGQESCSDVTTYQTGTKVSVAELLDGTTDVSNISATGGTLSGTSLTAGTTTVTLTGAVTQVIYTDVPHVIRPPGYLEVCKNAGDSFVAAGPWTFWIKTPTGGPAILVDPSGNPIGPVGPIQVLAGQCSGDIPVAAGQYTVQESFSAPDYVSSIAAFPPTALLGSNAANGSGTFSVSSQVATTAIFTNDVQVGFVKVCKTLTATSGALQGTAFNFNVSDTAGTQVVTVIAAPPGQTACSPDYTGLPIGSVATVTEQSQPNVRIAGVQVIPPSADGGSTSTTAKVIVGPAINSATFTNQAQGWVEVCKNAGDASAAGQIFNFSVNGGAPIPVMTGQCSQPIQVDAGTATVQEILTNPNYQITNITTVSVTDPTGSRLLSGQNNPATVTVPFGGVANETIVTFTNSTVQGAFKICTAQTSPDANLAGDMFTYMYSYTVNGVTTTGSVTLTVPLNGSNCSGIIATLPVINANGTPVQVSVTAEPPALTGVALFGFLYQGAGSVINTPTLPATFPVTVTIDLGAGMNVDTFTNGATH
jgi:hypothetical protein